MHAFDIIAWHVDGCVVCPDCYDQHNASEPSEEDHAVFADSVDEENGATCSDCHACLVEGEWRPEDDLDDVRFARCASCGHCRPFASPDADMRLASVRGEIACDWCRRDALHF